MARAGWGATDVDFLATTTCTGRLTPSIDAHLIARLGARRDVQRVHVGDTGCASAMVALQQAWSHLHAFPRHRALVVAVEICSAAYFLDDRLESAVAHAIFADGAGALALGADGPGPAVVTTRTLFRPEHLSAMGFEYPGGRPRVVLSKDVRRIGAGMMGEMARALMDTQGLKRDDIAHWVLHSTVRASCSISATRRWRRPATSCASTATCRRPPSSSSSIVSCDARRLSPGTGGS
jgi:predicted naringenin-chalcone synthase